MSYDKPSKTLTIYAPNGDVAFSDVPYLTKKGIASGGVIKPTGAADIATGFVVVGSVFAVLVAGGALYLVKTKKEA
jgi:hypothetical protein